MSAPCRVFVSYSRNDFYAAEQLAVALRRRGVEAWFDVHELTPGTDWADAIDHAIEDCDAVVLVASRTALASPYVQRERDLASRLGRLQVAVLTGWSPGSRPMLPSYDLRFRFRSGVSRLARDLAEGAPAGWRPRVRPPLPAGALAVALAPTLSVLLAVVLTVTFLQQTAGQVSEAATHVGTRIAMVATVVALTALVPGWLLWAFLTRRVSWLYLRGSLLSMVLVASVAFTLTGQQAAALTTDAIMVALGTAPGQVPMPAAEAVAGLLFVACVGAGVATELAPGLCRTLRTGAAPRRIRSRHAGPIPRPDRLRPLQAYRLVAADDDSGVVAEIRHLLGKAGIEETADGERDVVVLTDRTPVDWLSRTDLRDPVAVVATGIALPVRGLIQRFQWIDYRARRRGTLETLARDLVGTDPSAAQATDVPERLQQLRLPAAVAITEWTLYAIASLAASTAAYSIALAASGGREGAATPAGFCLAVAPVPVVLATRLRRRRITLPGLVLAVAGCWTALIALGLDGALQLMSPENDAGSYSVATVVYSTLIAAILGLSWRTLRRWLPARSHRSGQVTLGSPRGSWAWLAILVPALVSSVVTGILVPPPALVEPPPARAAADICRDQAAISALVTPLSAAVQAIDEANSATIAAAVGDRIPVAESVVHDLEGYVPDGAWGVEVRARVVAELHRTIRADRRFLDRELDAAAWLAEYQQLSQVGQDLVEPVCR